MATVGDCCEFVCLFKCNWARMEITKVEKGTQGSVNSRNRNSLDFQSYISEVKLSNHREEWVINGPTEERLLL